MLVSVWKISIAGGWAGRRAGGRKLVSSELYMLDQNLGLSNYINYVWLI